MRKSCTDTQEKNVVLSVAFIDSLSLLLAVRLFIYLCPSPTSCLLLILSFVYSLVHVFLLPSYSQILSFSTPSVLSD